VNWNYVRTAVGDQSKAESKEQLTQQPSALSSGYVRDQDNIEEHYPEFM